jgi:hypothetical protein
VPAYSAELNSVERWFLEFRKELSNRIFETVELLQEALHQDSPRRSSLIGRTRTGYGDS